MDNTQIDQLQADQSDQLHKLHKIVRDTIANEELIINNLLYPPKETLTRGQTIADKVARFGGSWNFIIIFFIILATWAVFNMTVPKKDEFDPYPFILLNLLLSFVAALQAPVIMMSQNRKEEKDRQRSENDYLINLKAEMQIRSLHQKMDLLLEEQIKTLYETQAKQLVLLQEISAKLEKFSKQ